MVQPTPLHYVNGGEPQVIACANCNAPLGDERAVAHTPGGVKFFCKMGEDEKVEDSCFLRWKMRRH